MGDEKTGICSTFLSATAFAALGLAAAGGAAWCAHGAAIASSDIGHYGDRAAKQSAGAVGGLLVLSLGLGLVALTFFGVAVWTVKLGLTDFRTRRNAAQDDSWKDMPYPKG